MKRYKNIPILFCDMDGVLVNFRQGHIDAFGIDPEFMDNKTNWDMIYATPDFYKNLPPMDDYLHLWDGIKKYDPVILTGVSDPEAPFYEDKKWWIRNYLGDDVEVIGVHAPQKCTYCEPGDIIIDDRIKYKSLWVDAGGIWIGHTSARESLAELKLYLA